MFSPRSIAVVGASDRPGSVGQTLITNLLAGGYAGDLYAVNDKRLTVDSLRCYSSVGQIGRPVDLVVIAVPAPSVAGVLEDCGRAGVRAAVVISAGFAECGGEGMMRQAELLRIARKHRIRMLGPNCVGILRPSKGMQAFFGRTPARAGRLALVSQSGALCTSILDWAAAHELGFSAVVSIGTAADVGFGDLLDYLAVDSETDAILVYVEGIDHARRFMSGLRAAARMKPVIVLKTGRHREAGQAATTHSGALIGDDAVFASALRRAGAVRVTTLEELFAAAGILSRGCRTQGDRLAIVSNAGGLGVMAADRVAEHGVQFARLSDATRQALDATLPEHWSHANPVDLIGDATPERYVHALDLVLADPGVDAGLVLLSPQAMTDPSEVAKCAIDAAKRTHKPVLACFMGGAAVREARALLDHGGVPQFPSPESAVDAFAQLVGFARSQRLLREVPGPLSDHRAPDIPGAQAVIGAALREGRTTLSLAESKALLAAFHIPITRCEPARSADEACAAAERIGLPVAMKIDARAVTHKSDVGGVRVGLTSLDAVSRAFEEMTARVAAARPDAQIKGVTLEPMHGKRFGRELLAGIARDRVFGPVISFGTGGTLVELIADRSVALPPLNRTIARAMIDRTRAARWLGEFRGMPAADGCAVENVLWRLSELACELPQVRELDINPLIADEHGVVAVDARVVLDPEYAQDGASFYPHVAIEPYPAYLTRTVDVAGEGPLTVRPIRPEDAEIERTFVHDLSFDSRYMRFHTGLAELTPAMLVRFTQIDYDREMAFVAVREVDGREELVGVSRYVTDVDGESCEFALTVADAWQGLGVGSALMQALIARAREKGLRRMYGEVLSQNRKMLDLARALGFGIARHAGDSTLCTVTLALSAWAVDA
jgi:acetyltransferase